MSVTSPVAAPDRDVVAPRKVQPVVLWAWLGAALLGFELYVIARWVTGPYFTPVPVGPDQPPGWMRTFLDVVQPVAVALMIFAFYRLLVRPWLRHRTLTFDGLFCVALFVLSFWDANSAYFGHWFQYNPYLLNRGSLVNDIPGWMAYGEPGHQIAFPYLVMPPAYVACFTGLMFLGCGFMRLLRARFPRLSNVSLVAACLGLMMLGDLLLEGFGFIRLGIWTYPGAPWALFGDGTRARYPISEMLLTGVLWTACSCLRYFRNDRGQSFFERGVDQVRAGAGGRAVLRTLALIAGAQVIMFSTYHVPMSLATIQSPTWPDEVVNTSWLNGGLCGKGTDRACPGEHVPIPRPLSPHLGPDGALVAPRPG